MSEIELPRPTVTVMRAVHSSGSVSFHCPPSVLDSLEDGDTLYTAEQVRQLIAAERERCARVCEAHAAPLYPSDPEALGLLECAAAIRRGSV